MSDSVNNPAHYQSEAQCSDCGKAIECIDIVQHENFNRGNAIKYIWRAGKKEGSDAVTDLRKSIKYLEFEVQRLLRNEPLTEEETQPSRFELPKDPSIEFFTAMINSLYSNLDEVIEERDRYRERVDFNPLVDRLRRDLDAMTADRDLYREQVFAANARSVVTNIAERTDLPFPDWSSAPVWAQWWAVDARPFTAHWFEKEPKLNNAFSYWYYDGDCRVKAAGTVELGVLEWFESKRKRPQHGV